ncbi:hypothetical protein BZA70DRAFT_272889 [Myxozyma melibiosi]|uniref:dolichol kinase n=1 Tax=Myxozyma melibiosi TaxID=54550 RepID=A0ABR1FE30_9ASCO
MSPLSPAYSTLAAGGRAGASADASSTANDGVQTSEWLPPSPPSSSRSSACSSVYNSEDENLDEDEAQEEEEEDSYESKYKDERGHISTRSSGVLGSSTTTATTARRRKLRSRRRVAARSTVTVLDGIKDGYNLGFRKKCVESVLILGLLALAVSHNLPTVMDNSSFVSQCALIIISVLYARRGEWSMPSILYIYLFPTALTLADYPQYLRLNLLLSVCSLPLPSEILSNVAVLLEPTSPSVYYLYTSLTSIVGSLVTTSLSPTETSLAGTLLVNLLLNARSMDIIFLRAFVFGSLFSLLPAVPLVKRVMKISVLPRHRRPKNSGKKKMTYALGVYGIFVANVLVFVRYALSVQLGMDPFVYMIDYLFLADDSSRRLRMLMYWSAWLVLGVPTINHLSPNWTIDIRRKVWHGMVVGMFLFGGVGRDATFTSLSLAIALTLFLLTEFVRATTMPPLGAAIHAALKKYTDERDTCGPVIVSHIFLLLGIALPIFWSGSPAGIICLGFGDACASIVGRRYGAHRWFDSKKTLEGSAGFVVAAFSGLMLAKHVLPGYDSILGSAETSVVWALVTAVSTAVLEATSGMNDNVIVPVYMYVVLRLGAENLTRASVVGQALGF